MAKNDIKSIINKITPWRVMYFMLFIIEKHRLPRLLFPRDYSDYIFRDNLLGRHNKHAYLADKIAVRDYVEECGLGHILTKFYGNWESANDIDFDTLPQGFALKCNHSCGTNIICPDKSQIDKDKVVATLNRWLLEKHPIRYEQHYRKIKPKVFCEELIPNGSDGHFPVDYKVHCANGHPIFIQCCFDRTETDPGKRVIYSTEWKNLHYVKNDYHYSEQEFPRPKHLDSIIKYASILSKGLEYARIDLYDLDDKVLFGEITLTPMGGWLSYFKQEALDIMGLAIKKYKTKNERKHQ